MAGSDDEGQSAKAGRAPGKRGKFSFRVTSDLRDKLEQISADNGRPVSEEIEMRLEESFMIDRVVSNAIDRSIKGGADAAVKALKDMIGGDHFFFVGMNLGVLYRTAVEETATPENEMAWLQDDEKFKVLKDIVRRGLDDWLGTIRGSSHLLDDPSLDKVTSLLSGAIEDKAIEVAKESSEAKAARRRRSHGGTKPSS